MSPKGSVRREVALDYVVLMLVYAVEEGRKTKREKLRWCVCARTHTHTHTHTRARVLGEGEPGHDW